QCLRVLRLEAKCEARPGRSFEGGALLDPDNRGPGLESNLRRVARPLPGQADALLLLVDGRCPDEGAVVGQVPELTPESRVAELVVDGQQARDASSAPSFGIVHWSMSPAAVIRFAKDDKAKQVRGQFAARTPREPKTPMAGRIRGAEREPEPSAGTNRSS